MTAASTSGMVLGKRYASHTLIYGTSTVIKALASFALLPIYTNYLTPRDYGVIELLTMLVEFSAIFFGARIGQSFLRYYGLATTKREKEKTVGSAYGMVVGTHAIGVTLLILFSGSISELLLGDEEYSLLVCLFSVALLLGAAAEIPFSALRAESKALHVLALSVTKLVLQISFSMLFLVGLDMGVTGVAYAAIISAMLVAIIVTAVMLRITSMSFSLTRTKQLLGFSLPIILAGVSMFVITYADRYFIRLHLDMESVGIYALAYKFGFMLFSLGWGPFWTMWQPERYKLYRQKENLHIFNVVFSFSSVFVVYIALGIALWVEPVLQIMSDPAFWSAARIVPVVLLAYVFLAWTDFVNLGIFVSGKTKYFGLITMAAALLCLLGYIFLIPRFGLFAAAWVTAATFFIRFLLIHMLSKREFDMGLSWYSPVMALGIAATLLYMLHLPLWSELNAMIRAAILSLAFPGICVALRVVPLHKTLATIRGLVKKDVSYAGR